MFYQLNPDKSTTPVADARQWRPTSRKEGRVAQTENEEFFISTVFLGIDHNFTHVHENDAPILFETMVFRVEDGQVNYSEIDMQRYSTWTEAEEGHKAMCEKYNVTTNNDQ